MKYYLVKRAVWNEISRDEFMDLFKYHFSGHATHRPYGTLYALDNGCFLETNYNTMA